ncbi:MAG: glycosyltransferase family 4 protein [Patescibacteria group bacterium]|nr:glycosyltransferase family 4 protein [Patescibacteria group bacterium]MDD5490480.1 glycosyltransferase family 4 protein [Patescibacteria group bacterium]
MRILFIGPKAIPLAGISGGVEKHIEELGARLAERGHEVIAYVRPRFYVKKISEYRGIKLVYIPSISTKNLDTITYSFLATIRALFQKADVIHYHGVGPSTLAFIPRIFKPKTKVIITFHSQDKFHKKWGWFARLYLSWGEFTACAFPHQTIAVSHVIQKYCQKKFKKYPVYIPNGVIPQPPPNSDKIKKWGLEKDSYILTVARLIEHKGIHHLLKAYNELNVDKKLVIVGAASYTDDYFKYLRELAENNSNIIFTGFQSGEDLAQLFGNAYIYVHPSEFEGLSLTILEAMSYGRCVLMSDIPENLELIDHSGVSFKNKDVEDLKNKIQELVNHPEIVGERGEKGKEFIEKNYNWDKIAEETLEIYKG